MTIRKRNDAVKPGRGISGTHGEDFSKPHGSGTSEFYKTSDHEERTPYSRNARKTPGDQWTERATEQPLRNVADYGYTAETRDVFDDVTANDGDKGGFSGPVKYGVNKPQSKR